MFEMTAVTDLLLAIFAIVQKADEQI